MTNSIINENTKEIFIGLDVHKRSISLACFDPEENDIFYETKVLDEYYLLLTLKNVASKVGKNCKITVGYEAGYCGFYLHRFLSEKGFNCILIAPDSVAISGHDKKLKTDRRDSINIAKSLYMNNFRPVYIPTKQDEAVRDLIRARSDHKESLKATRKRVLAFCDRRGLKFTEGKSHWTKIHLAWLHKLEFENPIDRITMDRYLRTMTQLEETIADFDSDIKILSEMKEYEKIVSRLSCIRGIGILTALSIAAEVGDFSRFKSAAEFASWVGVTPGEFSSGASTHHLGITKAGNSHLRHLLTESAQCYTRGNPLYKSKDLKKRQSGQPEVIVTYADTCAKRLHKKFKNMVLNKGKRHNVAITAITRELCCFIWGLATGNLFAGIKVGAV